ncbi:UNVERIFIED_CONTAM: hypothetical protein PYX00_010997 [Menopon gallinae]|uniref:AAA+ ATPase domain-containing protein n=1 Tax=Menopon gallinae TaxID=328185 RepID=A0AAW2H6W5_9NEOP
MSAHPWEQAHPFLQKIDQNFSQTQVLLVKGEDHLDKPVILDLSERTANSLPAPLVLIFDKYAKARVIIHSKNVNPTTLVSLRIIALEHSSAYVDILEETHGTWAMFEQVILLDKAQLKHSFLSLGRDATQALPYIPTQVEELGVNYLFFSSHKMLGPMGVGILWGKKVDLEKLHPYKTGGGSVEAFEGYQLILKDLPERLEAGSPNVEGILGFGAALDYLNSIGINSHDAVAYLDAKAGIRKLGTSFDLAIALGIWQEVEMPDKANPEPLLILGELHLDGSVSPVKGVLPAIISAKEKGIRFCIVPQENLYEVDIIQDIIIWGVSHLLEAIELVKKIAKGNPNTPSLRPFINYDPYADYEKYPYNFKQLKGHHRLKRALEIAAAGGHHVLMCGPPGVGKTLSVRCFPSILPPLSERELMETNKIWSLMGKIEQRKQSPLLRPFREPHHSASAEGMLGGGSLILPGEISLAHNGVLFLDEAPEFKKTVLQALREPLESRTITITRAGGHSFTFPANFQLVIAMNPCPCGNLGKVNTQCTCSYQDINAYWRKLGGALLDRIDLRIPIEPVSHGDLLENKGSSSQEIRERVLRARETQKKRYSKLKISKNSDLLPVHIEEYCQIQDKDKTLFTKICTSLKISGRAIHSILKVARSIADLGGEKNIGERDLLEAIQHRRYGDDASYWLEERYKKEKIGPLPLASQE